MNLLKFFSISFLLLFVVFSPTNTFGADAKITPTKAVIIADVSIHNAKIVFQKENTIKLAFEISNGQGSQVGLHPSVQLIKETPKGQFVVDKYTSPESFSLNSNEGASKQFVYVAPESLNGEYRLLISTINENGLMLGLGFTKNVKLKSTLNTLNIKTDSCYLSISGAKNNSKYKLFQAVSISSSERLFLNCSVYNPTNLDIEATPTYKVYLRNNIEKVLTPTTKGDIKPILFNAGKTKNIKLTFPKLDKPQEYNISFSLNNNNKKSNSVIAHYILEGESATIKNFSLDKASYKKGEKIEMSLFWAPSFILSAKDLENGKKKGSDVKLEINIVNNKNNKCIKTINQTLINNSKPENIKFSTKAKRNCTDPKVSIILKDSNGNNLDQKNLSFQSKTKGRNKKQDNNIILIFEIIVVVGLGIYFINLKKKHNEKSI